MPQPNTEVGDLIADVFQTSGLDIPSTAVVCSSIEMTWSLLATGRFLAVLPLSLLRFGVQRNAVKTLPVKLSVEPKPVGIVTLKNRTLEPGGGTVHRLYPRYRTALGKARAERHALVA